MNHQDAKNPSRARMFSLPSQYGYLILTFALLFCLTACTPVDTPPATSMPDYSLGSPVPALDNKGANPSVVIFSAIAILAGVIVWAMTAYPKTQQERQKIASEIGGEQVGGIFGIKFQKRVKGWTFSLERTSRYPSVRVRYLIKDGFQFELRRRDLLENLRTGVEIEDAEFEQHYIINTNNTAKLQTLLSNPKIRQIVLAQLPYLLTNKGQPGMLSKPFPDGVSELVYATGGDYFPISMDNIDTITSVYKLFEEIMNQLCAMGSASEDDPDIR